MQTVALLQSIRRWLIVAVFLLAVHLGYLSIFRFQASDDGITTIVTLLAAVIAVACCLVFIRSMVDDAPRTGFADEE